MKRLSVSVLNGIIYVYLMGSVMFFIPYYNWQYAKTYGFVEWVFLGELAATAKAFVWPLYTWEKYSNKDTVREPAKVVDVDPHFTKAIQYGNKVMETMSKMQSSQHPNDDIKQMISYSEKAVSEGKHAKLEALSLLSPDISQHFKEEYIKGFELFIAGLKNQNWEMTKSGGMLIESWSRWYVKWGESMQKKYHQ